MKRVIVALIICAAAVFGLCHNKPVVAKDENDCIIAVSQLAEKPKACSVKTDSLLVDGIQFTSDGRYINLIYFTDRAEHKFVVLTNFYKLTERDRGYLTQHIHINSSYWVSYVSCGGDGIAYSLESIKL